MKESSLIKKSQYYLDVIHSLFDDLPHKELIYYTVERFTPMKCYMYLLQLSLAFIVTYSFWYLCAILNIILIATISRTAFEFWNRV